MSDENNNSVNEVTGVTQEYLDEQRAFWEGVADGTIQPAEPTAALSVLEWISYAQVIHDRAAIANPEPIEPELIPQEPEWLEYEVPDDDEVDVDWQIDEEDEDVPEEP